MFEVVERIWERRREERRDKWACQERRAVLAFRAKLTSS